MRRNCTRPVNSVSRPLLPLIVYEISLINIAGKKIIKPVAREWDVPRTRKTLIKSFYVPIGCTVILPPTLKRSDHSHDLQNVTKLDFSTIFDSVE